MHKPNTTANTPNNSPASLHQTTVDEHAKTQPMKKKRSTADLPAANGFSKRSANGTLIAANLPIDA